MLAQKIAILGGGNMGRALAGGLLRQGARPETIHIGETNGGARAALRRDLAVVASADNRTVIADATVVVLAVKPGDMAGVLTPLAPILRQNRSIVLSIAAGIRVATLASWCGADVVVVRAMPNRPALVGAGATGLYAAAQVPHDARIAAESIMRAVGEIVWVDSEDALDVVTALSGSGPAYFFLLAELLTDAAVELGLAPVTARRLAVATLHGAGVLALASDGDLARLRAEVTSKGGTTEAAVRSLDAADLAGIIRRAVTAATARSRELAADPGHK